MLFFTTVSKASIGIGQRQVVINRIQAIEGQEEKISENNTGVQEVKDLALPFNFCKNL